MDYKKQRGFIIPLVITIGLLLIFSGSVYFYVNKKSADSYPVACTMEAKQCPDGSYVGRTGPKCEFSTCPVAKPIEKQTKFGQPIIMRINDSVIFSDSLTLVLKEISDSRCQPGTQCFWQGELAALFQININGSSSDIRLGTVNNKKVNLKGYGLSLIIATPNEVTIIINQ